MKGQSKKRIEFLKERNFRRFIDYRYRYRAEILLTADSRQLRIGQQFIPNVRPILESRLTSWSGCVYLAPPIRYFPFPQHHFINSNTSNRLTQEALISDTLVKAKSLMWVNTRGTQRRSYIYIQGVRGWIWYTVEYGNENISTIFQSRFRRINDPSKRRTIIHLISSSAPQRPRAPSYSQPTNPITRAAKKRNTATHVLTGSTGCVQLFPPFPWL